MAILVVLALGGLAVNRLTGSDDPSGGAAPAASSSATGRAKPGQTPTSSASTSSPSTSTPSASGRPTSTASTKAKIPASGPRKYAAADRWAPPASKRGTLIRYSVRVQKGLPYDPDAVARTIHRTLNDKRSWGRSGQWRLQLAPTTAKTDVEIYLVTRDTTDRLCAPLQTRGKVSCFNKGRVVLNADRWAYGAKSYGKDLADYRRNLINHEFGHSLGHGHVQCPGKGRRAPIMMQQTKGLHGCKPNPWPYPKG